ncbi:hypothetical protein PYCH_13580 [Pyrococcus yayanosii CH1]|uniref:Uncharacterized protein n=1 Tax=Pyrococcus yayanosii (strain CH1 / JCM 16557) TaxID=529709 RepID=F8AFQ2_PYRYC|nr:hypothetical protein PYCH_13580 [Pyrococcus yayanosii CH1]
MHKKAKLQARHYINTVKKLYEPIRTGSLMRTPQTSPLARG